MSARLVQHAARVGLAAAVRAQLSRLGRVGLGHLLALDPRPIRYPCAISHLFDETPTTHA